MRSQLLALAAVLCVATVVFTPPLAGGESRGLGVEGGAPGDAAATVKPPVVPEASSAAAPDASERAVVARAAPGGQAAEAGGQAAEADRQAAEADRQAAQIAGPPLAPGDADRAEAAAAEQAATATNAGASGVRARAPGGRGAGRPARSKKQMPWRPRRRQGVAAADRTRGMVHPRRALAVRQLRSLGLRGNARTDIPLRAWPEEPTAPTNVDRAAFYAAVRALCPRDVTKARALELAEGAVEAAAAFAVDPFLLVAYASHQSGCRAHSADSWGLGLTRIQRGMHRKAIRGGAYHYKRRTADDWEDAKLDLQGKRFERRELLRARTNLFFAAAFLKVAQDQCRDIDGPFGSFPHRHAVSHLVYGDIVRSALPEARILTERRRLLGYYRGERKAAPEPVISVLRGPPMVLPLDGSPRIVTGLMGDPRDGGRRTHYGIDLPAVVGEPVRAVADGVVVFAGADLRGRGPVVLPPERVASMRQRLGPRGIFVRVAHRQGMTSLYVHLADFSVRPGQLIHRGDSLGTVGLKGVHTSDAHLHFGLFQGNVPVDPMRYLGPLLRVNRSAVPGVDVWQAPLRRAAHQPLEAP